MHVHGLAFVPDCRFGGACGHDQMRLVVAAWPAQCASAEQCLPLKSEVILGAWLQGTCTAIPQLLRQQHEALASGQAQCALSALHNPTLDYIKQVSKTLVKLPLTTLLTLSNKRVLTLSATDTQLQTLYSKISCACRCFGGQHGRQVMRDLVMQISKF